MAAILVTEHGPQAPHIARQRQAQHAHTPRSRPYRMWRTIARAAEHLVGRGAA